MNIGDMVLYDKFGDRWATVAPSMKIGDQGVGIIVSNIFTNGADEFEDTMWARVLLNDGATKEIALCYLAQPNFVKTKQRKN